MKGILFGKNGEVLWHTGPSHRRTTRVEEEDVRNELIKRQKKKLTGTRKRCA
jgi:hypothetical protein